MALSHYLWSRVAASNATADPNINFAEGQAPSSVNDSARALMASAAGFRDDIAGAIATGGTSTAYTVTSYQVFDTLAHMNGQMIAFTPHATNGATVTLNVDGLGAKPLRSAPSTELLAGVLVLGTPYVATYNNSDAVWYLQNFYGNPYNVPLGGMLDYVGSSAPNTSFVLPIGQAISRTTYATMFSLISTTYGSGDGSTTFNVPDLTGRVVAMKEASATRLTSTYFGGNSANLGAVGGGESKTLVANNLPTTSPWTVGISDTTAYSFTFALGSTNSTGAGSFVNNIAATGLGAGTVSPAKSGSVTATPQPNSGGDTAFRTVQPTIVLNKILRVI